MELKLHTFLISALDRGEWSTSLSGRLIPGELNARYSFHHVVWVHFTRAWHFILLRMEKTASIYEG